MREEHFHFLSQPHRDRILLCLGDIAGNLSGIFMFFACDLACVGFWAALHLRWAGLAGVFQSLVFGNALACGFTVRIGIIAPKLLERLTFWTDVLVVLRVPFKVGAGPCAICPLCFAQHGNVGFDVAIN